MGGLPEVRSSRTVWPTWQNPFCTKNLKISQVWWWVPVISATHEAEAEKLLEPRNGGFIEPRLCHCTPAWVTRAKLRPKTETGFHHMGQAGLELLTSGDLPSLGSQSVKITGMRQCTQLFLYFVTKILQ